MRWKYELQVYVLFDFVLFYYNEKPLSPTSTPPAPHYEMRLICNTV